MPLQHRRDFQIRAGASFGVQPLFDASGAASRPEQSNPPGGDGQVKGFFGVAIGACDDTQRDPRCVQHIPEIARVFDFNHDRTVFGLADFRTIEALAFERRSQLGRFDRFD